MHNKLQHIVYINASSATIALETTISDTMLQKLWNVDENLHIAKIKQLHFS